MGNEPRLARNTELPAVTTDSSYKIVIARGEHFLYLIDGNDTVAARYPIGIGKESSPTPTGVFRVVNIVPNPKSYRAGVPDSAFGTVWIGLSEPHYGIHGTDRPQYVGRDLTDGCIRMSNEDVANLSRFIKIGTEVCIY